ncbi:hypothetical protein A9306_08965 [Moraxella atlantae]|uniref:Gp5/Type VI secretion system Vgr protein OB-fold domain-containing protein n=2 Tax=Faucicola atlantae TaxID=34059 RepID=A0A1B8QD27_9GAMM|nr:hypothetical protein A9306_08965 [Moraxella atlantae]
MSSLSPENERRMNNMVNRGIVTAVDYAKAVCRVQIDSLETDWLPFGSVRMGKVKVWNPPHVGEQVYLISETGELETALVLGSFAYDDQPNPSQSPDILLIRCDDGAEFSYHHANHELSIHLPDNSKTILYSHDVFVDCHTANINANRFAVSANHLNFTADSCDIDAHLTINGIAYNSHTHKNVQTGKSSTGGVNV